MSSICHASYISGKNDQKTPKSTDQKSFTFRELLWKIEPPQLDKERKKKGIEFPINA
jgi:hypothetical protein